MHRQIEAEKASSELNFESRDSDKLSKAKDVLAVISTTVTILGALGTLFVFLAVNYYVGDVEVACSQPFQKIEIGAFNRKGQSSTFYTPKFQLMPGTYHLSITCDGKAPQHQEAVVRVGHKTTVQVTQAVEPVSTQATDQEAEQVATKVKQHWWSKFLKKHKANDAADADPVSAQE